VLCSCCVVVPSHCFYLCTRLVSGDGRVTVAGNWCDLSGRGLGIGGLGWGLCLVGL
jgi:hypothetical protein